MKLNKHTNFFVIVFFVAIIFLFLSFNNKKTKMEDNNNNNNKCSFTQTYSIINFYESDDDSKIWVTLKPFQTDDIATIKLDKKIIGIVNEFENYEFTFEKGNNDIPEDTIYEIFKNSNLISINKTDKTGLDQINERICEIK